MPSISHIGLFPWCVKKEESSFKEGNDLEKKAVPLWWRVKEWKLEIEYEIEFHTDPLQYETRHGTQNYKVTDLKIDPYKDKKFETETDLVCAGISYDEESKIQYRAPADHEWELGIIFFVDSYIKIGPNLEFFFFQDDNLQSIGTKVDGDQFTEITIKMEGLEDFTVDLYSETVENALSEITSLTGTLEAVEYWEYDPNDGKGPIYNKDTGERIRFDI